VSQPWGIFFVKFEPKRLPVVALRRILSQVALKNRALPTEPSGLRGRRRPAVHSPTMVTARSARSPFAHFSRARSQDGLPDPQGAGLGQLETRRCTWTRFAERLTQDLAWPADEADVDNWRERWNEAFTLRRS